MTCGSPISRSASANRASIWSTSCSMTDMRHRGYALGDDLHADALLLGRVLWALDVEHRLKRRDGDRELGQVRLAGGQALQLQARPDEHLGPAVAAVAAEELDDLEREARDERDPD